MVDPRTLLAVCLLALLLAGCPPVGSNDDVVVGTDRGTAREEQGEKAYSEKSAGVDHGVLLGGT